jgi:hypothetical protein
LRTGGPRGAALARSRTAQHIDLSGRIVVFESLKKGVPVAEEPKVRSNARRSGLPEVLDNRPRPKDGIEALA